MSIKVSGILINGLWDVDNCVSWQMSLLANPIRSSVFRLPKPRWLPLEIVWRKLTTAVILQHGRDKIRWSPSHSTFLTWGRTLSWARPMRPWALRPVLLWRNICDSGELKELSQKILGAGQQTELLVLMNKSSSIILANGMKWFWHKRGFCVTQRICECAYLLLVSTIPSG